MCPADAVRPRIMTARHYRTIRIRVGNQIITAVP
jgi:hypothetical protein